jgi:hypothetical protein
VTGYAYAGSAAGGTLTIDAGGATYTLKFAGNFDTASFSLSAGPQLFTTSPPSLLITLAETQGKTTLVQVGTPPDAEYVLEGSDAFEPTLDYQGSPVTDGAFAPWTPLAAAELASGGYEVAWENEIDAGNPQYTVWYTDANANYVSSPFGPLEGDSVPAEIVGTIFSLPAIQHLPVTPIQIDGATTLVEVSDEYLMEDGSGFGPWLDNDGSPVTAGEFGAWAPIGAAELASGGYEVAWKNTSTGQYTVWDTDANGNYVSSPTDGAVLGDSYALEALEPSFQQDLNGDGTIGPTKTVIQTLDGTTLAELGAVNAEYVIENSGGSGPTLSNQGAAVTSGEYGAWTPVAAAELASGGYEVAWRNSATGQYVVWAAGANGDYLSSPTGGAVAGHSVTAEVLQTIFQVPGTTPLPVTPIQTDGSTTLAEIGDEYVMEGSDGFGPWLDDQNSPITAGQFGRLPGRMGRPASIRFGTPTLTAITSATRSARRRGRAWGSRFSSGASTRTSTATARLVCPPRSSHPSRPTARPP